MKQNYYSNGKLLITGEYAVLDGALSLALPTKYGQSLLISPKAGNNITWKSYTNTMEVWFETTIDSTKIKNYQSTTNTTNNKSDTSVRETLLRILSVAQHLNPNFLQNTTGLSIETHLDFPRNWGLGSSSTLINSIAQWAKVDAFKLLWKAFSGSGYDIACAQHNTPILYRLNKGIPEVEETTFDPPFKDQLFFVHLNQKQNSREGIAQYRKMEFNLPQLILDVEAITKSLLSCKKLQEFNTIITNHEQLIASTLQMETVKTRLFPDFPGSVKSLGAWGGDFILATGSAADQSYFRNKGYNIIIPYSDMIL